MPHRMREEQRKYLKRMPQSRGGQRKKHDWGPCEPPCEHSIRPSDIPHRAIVETISFVELLALLARTELGDETNRIARWE